MNSESGVQKAVSAAGGQSALARALGVKPQAVQRWVALGHVPSMRAREVERLTGVPRELLCPAVFA